MGEKTKECSKGKYGTVIDEHHIFESIVPEDFDVTFQELDRTENIQINNLSFPKKVQKFVNRRLSVSSKGKVEYLEEESSFVFPDHHKEEEKEKIEYVLIDKILTEVEPTNTEDNDKPKVTFKTIGPPTNIKFTNLAKVCLLFLNSPTPSKSTIEKICQETGMSAKDVKWIFIKLRHNFEAEKGEHVDPISVFEMLKHVGSTRLTDDVFVF